MAHMCRQLTGSAASCAGWVGLIVATATNDWVRTCDYTVTTCVRMDELGTRGLWAECTSRALMICASLLGLPAMLLVLMSMPCVRLQNDTSAVKLRRGRVGGVLFILMAVCGIIATVWFPIGVHQNEGMMSFGFSLYAGWVGCALCVLGGSMILCCNSTDLRTPTRENSFYYSRQRGTAMPMDPPANHAKSAMSFHTAYTKNIPAIKQHKALRWWRGVISAPGEMMKSDPEGAGLLRMCEGRWAAAVASFSEISILSPAFCVVTAHTEEARGGGHC
ncbi:hypothetical protein INR49_012199 [Caranx melampygus]|nr:hypothetical protein INR49_012199 [Caranx melampygus]